METEEQLANKTTFQNYLFLWIGQNFSYLGSAIVAFVIILQLAGGENYVLSVAAISSFGPSILFGALAGVLADRFNKKIIIIIADSLQAIATLALIILYYTITVYPWHIYVILGFRGICQAFHGPVVSALTPLMVPKEKLSRMNGIGYLLSSVIGIIGPIVGVSILLIVKVEEALWIDIISYVIAMIPIFFVKIPKVNQKTEKSEKQSFFTDMKEGFNLLRLVPGALSMIFLAMILNMLLQPLDVLWPNYILVNFSWPSEEIGKQMLAYTSAAFPIGILVGSLITSFKKKWKNKSKWILAGLILISISFSLLVLPKVLPDTYFFLIFVLNFLMALSLPIVNVLLITIMQTIIPVEKMGRISSLMMVFSSIASPLGMISAGFIADGLTPISGPMGGIGFTYVLCGVVMFSVSMLTYMFTDWRKIGSNGSSDDIEENLEEQSA
jgi:DHA3 family macrolide efflux protein-like MFS transporter